MALLFASLASLVNVFRRIRITQRWVWWVLFLAFPTNFSFYRFSFFCIYCNWCHPTNQISLMTIMRIMGQTMGPLVRALYLLALINLLVVLENPFVVSVALGMAFFFQQESSQLLAFSGFHVCAKRSPVQRWSTHRNMLAPKILVFLPSFKISLWTIVLFWPLPTHSSRCNLFKAWPGADQLDPSVGLPILERG